MKKVVGKITGLDKKVQGIVSDENMSKSAKMKSLFDLGIPVKEISDIMGTRYNFVYNVVSNYVNMNGIEIEYSKKVSKKDLIVELFNQGKSNKEISIELKVNYNYVFNTLKDYKMKQAD